MGQPDPRTTLMQLTTLCLFILFINPHPESGSQVHKKSTIQKSVWTALPTQGRATYVEPKRQVILITRNIKLLKI